MVERKAYESQFKFKQGFRLSSRESSWVEFKESFNWKSRAKYAKTISAFANTRGGFIVFGVRNNPRELVGLSNNNFENFDESKIAEYLNSVFSPEIQFEKFEIEIRGRIIGILYIQVCDSKPVVCIKNDNEIKEADIYYRYNARSEKIKYSELQRIIEEIRVKEERKWKELLKNISLADPSQLNVIFDSNMDIGKKKNTVRITDDASAPSVRVVEENLLEGYLHYGELVSTLRDRYSGFKANQAFHTIKRRLENNSHYCKVRYVDPQNERSLSKKYYHPDILKEFDKHYKLK